MPSLRLALPVFTCAMAFGLCLATAPAAAQAQKPTIQVASAADFVEAIGPNRIIVLEGSDYLLSSAYDVTSPWMEWQDSEIGKELVFSNVEGLEIRGVAGSRIVADSNTAYILYLDSCTDVSFDNVVFARNVDPSTDVSGGGLYIEYGRNISLVASSIEGENGYPIEITDCDKVLLRDMGLSQGFFGAAYISGSTDVTLEGCDITHNNGSPLLSVEESSSVLFKDCRFSDNEGGTFIDIYADRVAAQGIGFESCSFTNNSFDWFSSAKDLPTTDSCTWEGNSFDADWATASLAPGQDEGNYDQSATPSILAYAFPDTGLSIAYPESWELQLGEKNDRVGLFSPDGQSFLLFSPVDVRFQPGLSADKAKRTFEAAAAAFGLVMKKESGLEIEAKATAAPEEDPSGLPTVTWIGTASRAGGESAGIKIRLLASNGRVFVLAAIAKDPAGLELGGDVDGILLSFGTGN